MICSPDSDKIKLILDEVYAYSKKEILKVKQNLDDIYGPSSEEKKNGINQLHEHLKVHVAVSYLYYLLILIIKLSLFIFCCLFCSHFLMMWY